MAQADQPQIEGRKPSRRKTVLFLVGLAAVPVAFSKLQEWATPLIGKVPLFQIHKEPRPVEIVPFEDAAGHRMTFADFKGRFLIVNIWATWCPPCRKEMPALDRLRVNLMTGNDVEVIAVSIDKVGFEQLQAFYKVHGIKSLAIYRGDEAAVLQAYGVPGIPTTLLLNREGLEIARLVGPTIWDSNTIANQIALIVKGSTPRRIDMN